MTEYWVSQGNKWCEFCKIFISNNPSSIRNHELGARHKDNVAKRLDSMRKENVRKEKQQKEAARAFQQIEAKAKISYQKDLAALKEASTVRAIDIQENDQEKWDYDSTSGYYYNPSNGLHYDPKSGFYYSDAIGKWVTQQEAYATIQGFPKHKESSSKKPAAPGPVVSTPLNPRRLVKGAPSAVAVNKRKREEDRPKVISEEEKAALKAREAARKRVEEREKPLLGLYKR